jgi:hypothetical protein
VVRQIPRAFITAHEKSFMDCGHNRAQMPIQSAGNAGRILLNRQGLALLPLPLGGVQFSDWKCRRALDRELSTAIVE